MRKGARMMMIRSEQNRKNGGRNYDESSRRDSMESRWDDDMENRRNRDRMGRFTSGMDYTEMNGDYSRMNVGEMNMGGYGPYMENPSMNNYPAEMNRKEQRYGDGWELRRLVGFGNRNGGMDMTMGGKSDATMPQYNEMERMQGNGMKLGKAETKHVGKMTEHMAREWTRHMENEDGTVGPHWTQDQTDKVLAQHGLDCDPVEFWAAMNMMYSDYVNVAKKVGANTIDFYVNMAKAFLDDKDAAPGKLASYYEYVVKKG